MTLLKTKLIQRIQAAGPLSVAAYMESCLYDTEHGFYTTQSGLNQHFMTAPEVSQLFGEMLAIFFIREWEHFGAPPFLKFIELGAGRGTLAKDILSVFYKILGDKISISYFLVEISPTLRALQKQTLAESPYQHHWCFFPDAGGEKPEIPLTFIIANEFFDALPIHQYAHTATGWHERMVGIEADTLAFTHAATLGESSAELPCPSFPQEGSFYEKSPQSAAWISRVGECLKATAGTALIIDYGYERGDGPFGNGGCFTDTLQAIRHHGMEPPLMNPGEADLTAHVDFTALRKALPPALHVAPLLSQRDFLLHFGLQERLSRLVAGKPPAIALQLAQDAHRLVSTTQMGVLFKVLQIRTKPSP